MQPLDTSPESVFLGPAQMLVTETPTRIKTVLGSCVAITMRAQRGRLAAVAHCILPSAATGVEAAPPGEAARFVDAAVVLLLQEFASRGVLPADLEVKLFGGAAGLPAGSGGSPYCVGRRNVEAALELLSRHGIAPAAQDTGGSRGRLLEFHTGTGAAFITRLGKPGRSIQP